MGNSRHGREDRPGATEFHLRVRHRHGFQRQLGIQLLGLYDGTYGQGRTGFALSTVDPTSASGATNA